MILKIVLWPIEWEKIKEQTPGKKIKEVAKYYSVWLFILSYLIAQKNLIYVDCSLLQKLAVCSKNHSSSPPEQLYNFLGKIV